MEFGLVLVSVGALFVSVQARGPLCLHCPAVDFPHGCKTVKECWAWESCFAEHFLYSNGSEAFSFGCRSTQQCESQNDVVKRLDLRLCQSCCTEDLCNNNICTNGTVPPSGVPCLECTGVSSTVSCPHLTYCDPGEVCYAEKSSGSPNLAYNMGCVRKEVCTFFEEEIIGRRRSAKFVPGPSQPCHECCEESGCNHGACSNYQNITTESPQTTGLNKRWGTTRTCSERTVHTCKKLPPPTTTRPQARDCWELRTIYNITADGIYKVLSPNGNEVSMRCDMTTDGGGWIVFQKRYNGDINFDQSFTKYRIGFGTLNHEFWMGNDLLHEFTKDKKQKLRIDICSWTGAARRAEYDFFKVGPGSSYRLSVASYSGDAGDALITGSGGEQYHNNRAFSTSDFDNDASGSRHCAKDFRAGWWFGACFSADPNGIYQPAGPVAAGQGLQWRPWLEQYSFKGTELKFRPASANPPIHSAFKCPVQ